MFPNIKQIPKSYIKVFPEFIYKLKFNGLRDEKTKYSGCGAIIYKNNKEIWCNGFCIEDDITETHAEYISLINGLKKAYSIGISHLMVEGDSQAVINHMRGLYECNDQSLIELYCRAKEHESKFDKVSFNYIYKNDNKYAYNLSIRAINNYTD